MEEGEADRGRARSEGIREGVKEELLRDGMEEKNEGGGR